VQRALVVAPCQVFVDISLVERLECFSVEEHGNEAARQDAGWLRNLPLLVPTTRYAKKDLVINVTR
jgi:hypothetical protein